MTIYQLKPDRLWHTWDSSKPGRVTDCGQVCTHDNLYLTMKIGGDYDDPPKSECCPICFKEATKRPTGSPRPGYEYAPDLSIDPQHDIWRLIDETMKQNWGDRYGPIDREKFPLRIDEKILHGNHTIYVFHLQGNSLRDFVQFPTNMAEASLDASQL